MKFKEYLQESPVGQPGRTGMADAQAHISDDLIKDFENIVKKLGGKTVARAILGGFKPAKPEVIDGSAVMEEKLSDEFVMQTLADADINSKIENGMVHVDKADMTQAKKILKKIGCTMSVKSM